MKTLNSMIALSVITFLSFNFTPLSAEKAEETIRGFQGVKKGSANAETCKEKCTGKGTVSSGSCSDLNVYLACKHACKEEYLTDCKKAAMDDKYFNLIENCTANPAAVHDSK